MGGPPPATFLVSSLTSHSGICRMPPAISPDDTDWSNLVREQGGPVWRLARRLLDDEADAADCFQETFVGALRASRAGPVANWPGLLRKVCTARAVDLLRRRIRDRRRTASLESAAPRAAGGGEPGDAPSRCHREGASPRGSGPRWPRCHPSRPRCSRWRSSSSCRMPRWPRSSASRRTTWACSCTGPGPGSANCSPIDPPSARRQF